MSDNKTPTHIFLIPYRDRKTELITWCNNMYEYLNKQLGEDNYKVYVIHQLDNRMFNRGALCNIGFLEAKKRYPTTYKDIKFIIHDVDIYPLSVNRADDIIKYETVKGEARHPYGVLRPHLGGTLGGICIIYGEDYELINGMPNYFGWGGEDVAMSRRCKGKGITINEENFINRRSTPLIIDPESHLTDAKKKVIAATDKINLRKASRENPAKPINGLTAIEYTVDNNILLNKYTTEDIVCNLDHYNMIMVNFNIF
jgi:hypothetical protein